MLKLVHSIAREFKCDSAISCKFEKNNVDFGSFSIPPCYIVILHNFNFRRTYLYRCKKCCMDLTDPSQLYNHHSVTNGDLCTSKTAEMEVLPPIGRDKSVDRHRSLNVFLMVISKEEYHKHRTSSNYAHNTRRTGGTPAYDDLPCFNQISRKKTSYSHQVPEIDVELNSSSTSALPIKEEVTTRSPAPNMGFCEVRQLPKDSRGPQRDGSSSPDVQFIKTVTMSRLENVVPTSSRGKAPEDSSAPARLGFLSDRAVSGSSIPAVEERSGEGSFDFTGPSTPRLAQPAFGNFFGNRASSSSFGAPLSTLAVDKLIPEPHLSGSKAVPDHRFDFKHFRRLRAAGGGPLKAIADVSI